MASAISPKAPSCNIVEFGKARFTLLTANMLRLEWAADSIFEDRASMAAVNRKMPAVKFTQKASKNVLTIKTDALTLKYTDDGKKLSAKNLEIKFKSGGKSGTWSPGMKDNQNLKGTSRTLDNCAGRRRFDGKKMTVCDGLLSTSGWAAYDDSAGILFDDSITDQPWASARKEGRRQDIYFLAYGLDFKAALCDTAKIFGHQPLPPRFVFGYWWSRYWEYNDKELEQLVSQCDLYGLPLDVLVIDMDWHKEGWTGYSWDERYFPDHKEFLGWLKDNDLKITLNLHPADGVAPHEDMFEDMAKTLGVDPKKSDQIEFDITDPKFVDAYFKHLHHPHEDAGVDFWWMDWQQGTATRLPGLDPLPWLNHLHYVDMEKRSPERRPLIFSRFGGLGAGRYPVGFSGDTTSEWKSLAYQPEFTATAANIHYGYWSHDIGGHYGDNLTAELYLRWVQFGIFNPILRTHTSKKFSFERKMWEYPAPYSELMIKTIAKRYELVPYIYTECRKITETGLSLCRPMYHEYPTDDGAYKCPDQYMFGDDMIVAPVIQQVSNTDEMAAVSVWLPKGKWFDAARGVWITGGKMVKNKYMINEIPAFVRPGTIIPGQKTPKRLRSGSYRDLVITAYPGGDGSYELYEDDGVTQAYTNGDFATIAIEQKSLKTKRSVTIKKAKGSFKGFDKTRSLELRLPAASNVKAVKVGGKALDFAYRLGDEGWSWDAELGGVIVRVKKIDVTADTKIDIEFSGNSEAATGMCGAFSRLERIRQLGSYLSVYRKAHELSRLHADALAATTRVAMQPDTINSEKRWLKKMLPQMDKAIRWRLANSAKLDEQKKFAKQAIAISKELQSWF